MQIFKFVTKSVATRSAYLFRFHDLYSTFCYNILYFIIPKVWSGVYLKLKGQNNSPFCHFSDSIVCEVQFIIILLSSLLQIWNQALAYAISCSATDDILNLHF